MRLLRLFEVGSLKRFLALVSYWGIHSTYILPYSGLTKCFRYHVCFHLKFLFSGRTNSTVVSLIHISTFSLSARISLEVFGQVEYLCRVHPFLFSRLSSIS